MQRLSASVSLVEQFYYSLVQHLNSSHLSTSMQFVESESLAKATITDSHTLIEGNLIYVFKYVNKTTLFAVSVCLFANLTVKSYEASALLVSVTTYRSVNVCMFRRVREYHTNVCGSILLNSSDPTTHRAVLPKHMHSYSTETSANLSHWITVIS